MIDTTHLSRHNLWVWEVKRGRNKGSFKDCLILRAKTEQCEFLPDHRSLQSTFCGLLMSALKGFQTPAYVASTMPHSAASLHCVGDDGKRASSAVKTTWA